MFWNPRQAARHRDTDRTRSQAASPTLLRAQLQQVSQELRSLFHEIRYNSVVQQLFLHVPFQQHVPSGGHFEGPHSAKSLSSATESTVGFLGPISAKISTVESFDENITLRK